MLMVREPPMICVRGHEYRARPAGKGRDGGGGWKERIWPLSCPERLHAVETRQDNFLLKGSCCLGRVGWLARLGGSVTPHSVFAAGKSCLHFCQGKESHTQGSLAVWVRSEMSPTRTRKVMPRCSEDKVLSPPALLF